MLSVAALSATALSVAAAASPMAVRAATAVAVFSPSAHPFMRRAPAAPTHFSFDPYKMVRAQMNNTVAAAAASQAAAAPCAIPAQTALVPAVATSTRKAIAFRVVTISFKQGAAKFRAPFRLAEGDVVVVEGDRGEHIGTVKAIHPIADTESLMPEVKGKILRRATAADLAALEEKAVREAAVLTDIAKVAKEVRLNASIADVEYQFDNNKLTIYVERATSTTFVDFRKVQRTLFKMFRVRIWFIYMDELTN